MEPYLSPAAHRTSELRHRFARIADDIRSRPDAGPYETGVLQHLAEVAGELGDVDADKFKGR